MKIKNIVTVDLGETVMCDICSKDYTDSDKSGGFLFDSYAYCPKCAGERLSEIRRNGELGHIKAICPKDQSFKDFVLDIRDEDNTITIASYDNEPEDRLNIN